MAFLTSNWTTHLWHRLLHPLKLRWPVDDTNNTIKFSQQREREVIWLIRAEILEKRPVRRQYITVLTTGTIKLLCHVLFLAWEQGLFIPRRLNIQLCLLLVVNGWRKRRGGQDPASKQKVKPQTAAGEVFIDLFILISTLQWRYYGHIVHLVNL